MFASYDDAESVWSDLRRADATSCIPSCQSGWSPAQPGTFNDATVTVVTAESSHKAIGIPQKTIGQSELGHSSKPVSICVGFRFLSRHM